MRKTAEIYISSISVVFSFRFWRPTFQKTERNETVFEENVEEFVKVGVTFSRRQRWRERRGLKDGGVCSIFRDIKRRKSQRL